MHLRTPYLPGVDMSQPLAAGFIHTTAAAGLGAVIAGMTGWLSPTVGIIAGLCAIFFYGFQIWESRTVKARYRLRRRRWAAAHALEARAKAAQLLVEQTATTAALLVVQTADAAQTAANGGQPALAIVVQPVLSSPVQLPEDKL